MHRTLRASTRLRAPRLRRAMSSSAAAPTPTPPATPSPTPKTQALLELSAQYLLPVYARPSFVLSHGAGSYVYDTTGKRYLDFSAGIAVNALGHADAGVVEVRAASPGSLLLLDLN